MTVTSLQTGNEVTTRDPGVIRAEWKQLCTEAREAGWPDDYGPRLDELKAEFDAAYEQRGYMDLWGFPLTPYVLRAVLKEAMKTHPWPKPDRMCCLFPECCSMFPEDHTHCWRGHQQLRGLEEPK